MFEREEQICKKIESEYFSIINNRPEFRSRPRIIDVKWRRLPDCKRLWVPLSAEDGSYGYKRYDGDYDWRTRPYGGNTDGIEDVAACLMEATPKQLPTLWAIILKTHLDTLIKNSAYINQINSLLFVGVEIDRNVRPDLRIRYTIPISIREYTARYVNSVVNNMSGTEVAQIFSEIIIKLLNTTVIYNFD